MKNESGAVKFIDDVSPSGPTGEEAARRWERVVAMVFSAFIIGTFIRALIVFPAMHDLAKATGDGWAAKVDIGRFGEGFTSVFLGLGIGAFSAAAFLADFKLVAFFHFFLCAAMLAWLRGSYFAHKLPFFGRMGSNSWDKRYMVLHLMAGFSAICEFFHSLPNGTDRWYWAVYFFGAVVAPFAYHLLGAILVYWQFQRFIQSIIHGFLGIQGGSK